MTETKDRMTDFKIGIKQSEPFEIPEMDDGVYNAKLIDIELRVDIPDGKGGKFDKLNWNFDIDGKKIISQSSTTISNLSKAFGWIKALTGKEPEIGKDFSPSSVNGKSCQVIIKHRAVVLNTETVQMPYVSDVLPVKKSK